MAVTAAMPVRFMNLVGPLGKPPTAMHTTDTTGHSRAQVRCSYPADRPQAFGRAT